MLVYTDKKIFILLLAVVTLAQMACKKDNTAGPSISGLRSIAPAPNDSALTVAGPGQWVVIKGAHLGTASAVSFNGWPASFNSALFSDNSLAVNIPADMPFASLDTAKLNTVTVVTPNGTATYKFPIVPPPPVVTGISNENAVAGTAITIYGFNFFYISKVIFPGGITVSSGMTSNTAGTTLNVTVPSGITTGGTIQVMNRYGTGVSIVLFNDLTTGVLNNYDNINHFVWGSGTSNSSTTYPGNRGTYGIMSASAVGGGDYGWWNGSRSVNTDSVQWVPVGHVSEALGNYALKFEINVTTPWKDGTLFIVKDGNWKYIARYEPWLNADGSSSAFTTHGWLTVTLPLSMFKDNPDPSSNTLAGTGNAVPSMTILLGAGGVGAMDIMYVNTGKAATGSFEAAIDNIRVERVVK